MAAGSPPAAVERLMAQAERAGRLRRCGPSPSGSWRWRRSAGEFPSWRARRAGLAETVVHGISGLTFPAGSEDGLLRCLLSFARGEGVPDRRDRSRRGRRGPGGACSRTACRAPASGVRAGARRDGVIDVGWKARWPTARFPRTTSLPRRRASLEPPSGTRESRACRTSRWMRAPARGGWSRSA